LLFEQKNLYIKFINTLCKLSLTLCVASFFLYLTDEINVEINLFKTQKLYKTNYADLSYCIIFCFVL